MITKATWICGLSLLLAGSSFAQYTNAVYSDANDGVLEFRAGWTDPIVNGNETGSGVVRVGDWFSGLDSTGLAVVVFPFLLPDAGVVSNPFTSAELQIHVGANQLSLNSVADLDYVRTAATNALEVTDYDSVGTLIETDFITPAIASNSYVTTTAAALLNILNTEYANGAGAGSYVFLRLTYSNISNPWAAPGDYAEISTRNSGFQNDWPTLTLTDNVDQDADGLPDSWEIFYFTQTAISNILYVGSSDNDFDFLDNDGELANGTNPNEPDTDGDGLTDGDEVNLYLTDPLDFDTDGDFLSDGLEITNTPYASDPLDIDSDDDNVNDATEFYCGSNPTNAASLPSNAVPEIIGVDFFDYYNPTNPSIWSLAGGEFFDIDNTTSNDAYLGHTCDISDWYDTSFNAGDVVNQGLQTSGDSLALRAFNGINTGGMTLGVFSTDPATGSTTSNVYFRVKMTVDGTASYAGLSFYNGGDEVLFFGKTGGNGNWGVDGADVGVAVTATNGPLSNVEYAMVGKIDLSAESVTLWLDPSIAGGEGSATPIATSILGGFGPYTYNAIRLASGGSGSVRWDDLVIAYTWDDLDFEGTDSDVDGLRDTWELIWTNTLTVLSSGADFDSDGLDDDVELGLLTDPTNSDSDGDGLDDNYELTTNGVDNLYITDPADADSDDDGLSDGYEVTTNGVDNIYFTNPLDKDTDADTYDDDVEIAFGTDPTNPSDSPGGIIIDGNKDGLYGDPVAVQTIETQFGDNFSEWNAAYSYSTNGYLYLMFTGNLENNGNRLEIFIDSTDDITTNVLTAAGNDGTSVMDGMTFDTDFSPEYHFNIWRDGGDFNIDLADLVVTNISAYTNIFAGSSEGSTTNIGTGPANASPIAVAHDNSNTAGIGGSAGGAADTNAAIAVTTGLEICIALSDIGNPTGTVKVALIQNGNSPHDYLSNQTLGGLPVGTGNLGAVGAPSTINFNSYAGDQFFTAAVQAGVSIGPFSITSIQLINGNADVELILNGLTIGQDYKIQDSLDLTAGFTDVGGSQFTATDDTAQSVVLPTDTSTQPERFFEAATAP